MASHVPAWPHEVVPLRGPGDTKLTSLSGSCTGKGRNNMLLKIEKIATFAPMPSAIDSTAMVVTMGVFSNDRIANLNSCIGGLDDCWIARMLADGRLLTG